MSSYGLHSDMKKRSVVKVMIRGLSAVEYVGHHDLGIAQRTAVAKVTFF